VLTIGLPKGRLQKPALERFAAAGIVPEEDPGSTRRLIVPARGPAGGPAREPGREPARGNGARFVLLKDADVPLYVERGAADLGVCGLDQVLESGADLLTPIDFGFGRCRLCLAAQRDSRIAAGDLADAAELGRSLRVASKYPRLAARWFARRGVPVDLVRLSGSVELAAVSGLADAIVDLVESGRTLEENGLVVVEELLQVSARLVVNRAAYRLKIEELLPLLDKLEARP
jgi:ATP phosphoribosyltransferase